MERRANPTPAQMLAEVDRLIGLRHDQHGELRKLRDLLVAQVILFQKVGRRAADKPGAARRASGVSKQTQLRPR